MHAAHPETGPRLEGVIPILQTPFRADESLDLASLERLVGSIQDDGAAGAAFPAFASEWWALTDAEVLEAAACICGAMRPGHVFVGSVTGLSTRPAIERIERFAALGAHAIMVMPPFIVAPNPLAGLEHLHALLDSTDLQVMLQYSPTLTGSVANVEQLLLLAERHPNLRGVKVDAIPTGPTVSAVRNRLADWFAAAPRSLFVGFSGLQLPDALARGANGLMGGCGHVAADVEMFNALVAGEDAGREAFARLLPLLNFEMQSMEISVAAHKQMLHRQGLIASPTVRGPLRGLDATHLRELDALTARLAGAVRR